LLIIALNRRRDHCSSHCSLQMKYCLIVINCYCCGAAEIVCGWSLRPGDLLSGKCNTYPLQAAPR
jgi:hypothetical protein